MGSPRSSARAARKMGQGSFHPAQRLPPIHLVVGQGGGLRVLERSLFVSGPFNCPCQSRQAAARGAPLCRPAWERQVSRYTLPRCECCTHQIAPRAMSRAFAKCHGGVQAARRAVASSIARSRQEWKSEAAETDGTALALVSGRDSRPCVKGSSETAWRWPPRHRWSTASAVPARGRRHDPGNRAAAASHGRERAHAGSARKTR